MYFKTVQDCSFDSQPTDYSRSLWGMLLAPIKLPVIRSMCVKISDKQTPVSSSMVNLAEGNTYMFMQKEQHKSGVD